MEKQYEIIRSLSQKPKVENRISQMKDKAIRKAKRAMWWMLAIIIVFGFGYMFAINHPLEVTVEMKPRNVIIQKGEAPGDYLERVEKIL